MNKIICIASKELKVSFQTPVAYILLCLSLTIFNIFFFIIIDENREATLRDMFTLMEFMFVFLIPLITMKTLAQEKESGTMEFLKTTPTTDAAIILGKYFGVLMFFSIMILLTLPYYLIIEHFGAPDRSAVLVGYLGLWLEGAFFIAIGIMTSSFTKSQVLAAMTSYILILLLYFSLSLTKYVSGSSLEILKYITVMPHTQNYFAGMILTSDIVYFLTGIVLCLMISRLGIEERL
ncbi:MAG: ABC transporter permease subunit [Candidatus Omnitrophica bacterium]|nr:ABC transporter permease subunit [Candidatus Omnitrophota bacterium]